MNVERTHARTGWKHLLVSGVIDLALVVAALLSMASAPAKSATLIQAAKPRAVEVAAATPREAIADRDTLDLQLD